MDSPESYRHSSAGAETPDQSRRTIGIVALCICLGSFLLASLLGVLTANDISLWIPYLLFIAGQITALLLGIISWSDPFGKAAAVTSPLLIVLSVLLLN
jgi:hypothetical protein